jgi:hypothetical protein
MFLVRWLAVVSLVWVFSLSARADVAPEEPVIGSCAADQVAQPGETCLTCQASLSGASCEAQFAGKGYVRRCRTHGIPSWSEVWCKTAQDAGSVAKEQKAPQPSKNESCASVEPTLLALAGIGSLRRRRALR